MPRSTVDGKIYNTAGSPYSYSVAATSEHPDEAIQLIDFLSRADNNIEYCKMGGLIPINKDVADDPTYGEDGMYGPLVDQLNDPDFVVPPMYGPFSYTDLHQDTLHTELQRYLLGEETAEDVLNGMGKSLLPE